MGERILNYALAFIIGICVCHVFYQARDNHFLEDYGFPSPVVYKYHSDTKAIITAKLYLKHNLTYVEYKVLIGSHCFDQVLDKLLNKRDWQSEDCYDRYGHLIYFYKEKSHDANVL